MYIFHPSILLEELPPTPRIKMPSVEYFDNLQVIKILMKKNINLNDSVFEISVSRVFKDAGTI